MAVRTLFLALSICVAVTAGGCSESDDDDAPPLADDPAPPDGPPPADVTPSAGADGGSDGDSDSGNGSDGSSGSGSGSGSDGGSGNGSGSGSDGDGGSDEGASAAGAIGVDTHVELLAHLFDIYTGNAYGPTVIALPDYSAVPDPPAGDPALPFTATDACINGGTVGFERIYWGTFQITEGWVYDFEDCQDGADVLDGRLSAADNGSDRFVSSPGFTRETQSGRLRFRGNVDRLYRASRASTDARHWTTVRDTSFFGPNAYDPDADGVDFVRSDASGNATFELLGARTDFGHLIPVEKYLSGSFSIRSEATGGERLEVTVLERFYHDGMAFPGFPEELAEHPDFETGVLRVSAGNGDTLVLDAATGDRDTARVEITVGGVTETLTQPWSLWHEHLEFDEAFLGGR